MNASTTSEILDILSANMASAALGAAFERQLFWRLSEGPKTADFLHDELPGGFDMVLECDVGLYSEAIFCKLAASLNEGGRLVIVGELPQAGHSPGLAAASHNFYASLSNPDYVQPTSDEVAEKLRRAGFRLLSSLQLSSGERVLMTQK